MNIGVLRFFKKTISILDICKTHLTIILLGNISGFVTGAKLLNESNLSSNSKNPSTKSLILSSNAGIGFVISFVGLSLWNNIQFGIFLYFLQIAISLFLNCFVFFKPKNSYSLTKTEPYQKGAFISSFVNSVSSSTNTIITVCSYTIIFSLLANIFVHILNISVDSVFSAIIFSLFDITQGLKASIMLENNILSAFFTGFAIGFGGISVAFQIFSTSTNLIFSKKKYIFSKLMQGIICGVFSSLYVKIFKISPSENAESCFSFGNTFSIYVGVIFILLCFFRIKKYFKSILLSKKC